MEVLTAELYAVQNVRKRYPRRDSSCLKVRRKIEKMESIAMRDSYLSSSTLIILLCPPCMGISPVVDVVSH